MKTKRKTQFAAAGILLSLLFLLSSACASPVPQRFSKTDLRFFDTVSTLTGYAPDRAAFDKSCDLALGVLERYHRSADLYHDYPGLVNLKTLNDSAGEGPVSVPEELMELLQFGVEAYSLTGGRVNVAMGAVLSLWHEARENERLPEGAALERAAEHCAIEDLVLDPAAGTASLLDPEMRLDLGAVAKGYATEMAARALEKAGVGSFVLDIGGNVRTLGEKPDGGPWRIGIQDPERPEGVSLALSLRGEALVTSGSYQRYFELDGVRYHHIIDPDTLYPESRMLSVSVLTGDAGLGDVLSTGLFNMDPEKGLTLVEGLEGVEAFWILPDGSTLSSSGLEEHLR